jgi:hypothetical protein
MERRITREELVGALEQIGIKLKSRVILGVKQNGAPVHLNGELDDGYPVLVVDEEEKNDAVSHDDSGGHQDQ